MKICFSYALKITRANSPVKNYYSEKLNIWNRYAIECNDMQKQTAPPNLPQGEALISIRSCQARAGFMLEVFLTPTLNLTLGQAPEYVYQPKAGVRND